MNTTIRIVDHREELAPVFYELNAEWLREMFRIEPYDQRQLSNPQKEIVDRGGDVLYAEMNDRAVGTVALVYVSPHRFELTKLAVARGARNQGVGEALVRATLRRAKQKGARDVVLITHKDQAAAVRLYERIGFVRKNVTIPSSAQVERSSGGITMVFDFNEDFF